MEREGLGNLVDGGGMSKLFLVMSDQSFLIICETCLSDRPIMALSWWCQCFDWVGVVEWSTVHSYATVELVDRWSVTCSTSLTFTSGTSFHRLPQAATTPLSYKVNPQPTHLLHYSTPSCNYESSTTSIVYRFPEKIQPYLRLIRLDRPIGTWLVYWPSTWGIAMATSVGHFPDVKLLLLFGAGSFVMRGAGCTINDLWDRDIDKKVNLLSERRLAVQAWGWISPHHIYFSPTIPYLHIWLVDDHV